MTPEEAAEQTQVNAWQAEQDAWAAAEKRREAWRAAQRSAWALGFFSEAREPLGLLFIETPGVALGNAARAAQDLGINPPGFIRGVRVSPAQWAAIPEALKNRLLSNEEAVAYISEHPINHYEEPMAPEDVTNDTPTMPSAPVSQPTEVLQITSEDELALWTNSVLHSTHSTVEGAIEDADTIIAARRERLATFNVKRDEKAAAFTTVLGVGLASLVSNPAFMEALYAWTGARISTVTATPEGTTVTPPGEQPPAPAPSGVGTDAVQ